MDVAKARGSGIDLVRGIPAYVTHDGHGGTRFVSLCGKQAVFEAMEAHP